MNNCKTPLFELNFASDTTFGTVQINISAPVEVTDIEFVVKYMSQSQVKLTLENAGIKIVNDVIFIDASKLERLPNQTYNGFLYAKIDGSRELLALSKITISETGKKCSATASLYISLEEKTIELTIQQNVTKLEGLKGKAFTYEDFTPEQLDDLRLKFEQLTPEQKEELKGDAGAAFTFDMFTQQQLESLRGPKGSDFKYTDFTAEQIETLQQPAIAAAAVANQAAVNAAMGWTEQRKAEEYTVNNTTKIIEQVTGYVGGTGVLPTVLQSNIGKYRGGTTGYTSNKAEAFDFKGGNSEKVEKILADITRTSYNILDIRNVVQKGSYTTGGNVATSNNTFSTIKMPVGKRVEKRLTGVAGIGSTVPRVLYWDAAGSLISYLAGSPKYTVSDIIIPSPPANAIMFAINLGSVTGIGDDLLNNPILDKIMLIDGTASIPYEPFGIIRTPQDEIENWYVSNSGSDENPGTFLYPFKTIGFAINKLPLKTIRILEGDYYELPDFSGRKVEGIGNVRIIAGKKIKNATLISGKVWKANENIPKKNQDYELWQHDIADSNSLIPISERHAMQGGLQHRLGSTRLFKASSIADIESRSEPSWYHDGTTFYFSKVDGSDIEVNPIVIPSLAKLFNDATFRNVNLLYSGLSCRSGASNIEGGSILYCNEDPISVVNAEMYIKKVRIGGAHNNGIGYIGGRGLEVDCWVHDCLDEGSSAHGSAIVTRKGGYYEHNVSATIDVGNVTIYNEGVLALYNNNGFSYSFYIEGARNDGTATLVNCITDKGISSNTTGRVKALNCKAKGGIGGNIEVF